MTDFEPVTDVPDRIDTDDTPVASTAKTRDEHVQQRRHRILVGVVVIIALGLLVARFSPIRVIIASLAMYAMLRLGFAVIGAFARPIPKAPPEGELRRVRLKYRCSVCGTEIRMTLANDEI
ncbi:MAG: hypothetical protein OEW83_18585, partial [Acidimicrobiia bacterium]|nr:hypothetical protein [Acidimicrobiia bacterium]